MLQLWAFMGRPAGKFLLFGFKKNLTAIMIGGISMFPMDGFCQGIESTGTATSLVEPQDWISDYDARHTLAQILSYDEKILDEALAQYKVLLAERPQDAGVRREAALAYMRQKNYGEALREFAAVLAFNPGDVGARLSVGRIYLWTGRFDMAIGVLGQLRQEEAGRTDGLLELARAYTWSKNYNQAMEAYRELLHCAGRGDFDLLIEAGDAHLYGGQKSEAIGYYRAALNFKPHSDAGKKKLGLALSWNGNDEEAFLILRDLYSSHPDDREISLELARLHVRRREPRQAMMLLDRILGDRPRDSALIAELADVEASLGHAQKCREYYLKALEVAENREEISLRFADRMNIWGDFYEAERIYRNYAKGHPAETGIQLKLASLLASSQRYEEAEGVYRQLLLRERDFAPALLGLARLKLLEKDFDGSFSYIERYLSANPGKEEALLMKGEALFAAKRFPEALEIYEALAKGGPFRVQGLLGAGRVYLKRNETESARRHFGQALQVDPENAEANFQISGLQRVGEEKFVSDIIKAQGTSPGALEAWAQLYASQGFNRAAIQCYEAALEQDPEYFPARIGLAELLGVDRRYDRALRLYAKLSEDFPGDSKILIGWARVLGWSKRYRESIDLYRRIHRLNPADPVPQKERARTAVWGKMFKEAMDSYNSLLTPAVDDRLSPFISSLPSEFKDALFREDAEHLNQKGSLYQKYEKLADNLAGRDGLGSEQRQRLEEKLVELLPAYRVQKAVDLEQGAKRLVWEKRPTQALPVYEKLIRFNPGNEEARFDYAQVECSLGLCDREGQTHRQLLEIDPQHNLAAMALEQQRIRTHPFLQLDQLYWKERGFGELSGITRYRTDLGLDLPIQSRYHLRLTGTHWIEHPTFTDQSYAANGFSLQAGGVVTPYFKADAGWTQKRYNDAAFGTKDTGHGNLRINLKDYAQVEMGYERSNEIYNYFSLKQGVQADRWSIRGASQIIRNLEITGAARFIQYTDDNQAQHYSLGAGYALTESPRILKVILSSDYRDTKNESQSRFNPAGTLTDITHPYWTPKHYLAGRFTLEWYHDLSSLLFCGSELHYYDLRLTFGTDTDNNPAIGLEGEWHYEFYKRWTAGLRGLVYRSREWNADSLQAMIRFRF